MQGKNYFFSKKFKIPKKCPLTAKKAKPSRIQHRASGISFWIFICHFAF